MTATLFQASQDGNVELVTSLLEEPSLDIDARDETGLTALHHAVRGNHIDVVSQLLAKGANAVEVAQDAALKHNPELASVVNNALQHTQSASFQSAPVVDSHGGKQLPDGTVSYVQPPAYQGHAGMDVSMHQQHAALHHPMSQPMYPFQPQHAFFDPSHNPEHRGHAHKDSSSGSLPPPEVAKMIPCRFFPNCRYGDKCMFAHPVAMPASASNAGPVSPGQAPMFYQSPAYGYPAYGPPQHFYSMAPPMPIQYTHAGVPMPVHMPPPPHMAPAPHSAEHGDAYGNHFGVQSRPAFESNQLPEGEVESATNDSTQQVAAEASSSAAAPADADADANADKAAAPATEAAAAADEEPAKSSSSTAPAASSTNTTSFSAFMAHHATPFQPGPGAQNGVSVGADGSILNNSQTFTRGAKLARRGGASMGGSFGSRADFSKRSTERPACHFFARSACKHGEDCRFPHILPDGTDMRGPNAGRSGHSIEASRAINRALAAKSARGSANGSNANGAQSSQGASASAKNDTSSLPPAPTNMTVSTSPASAQTTITPADTEEASKASSMDKATSREDAAEQKPAANVNLPASSATAAAAKKEQSNGAKAANVGGAAAAASSTPKASSSNAGTSAKTDPKVDNAAHGKRAGASGAKAEEAKPAAAGNSNGDRVPASIPSKPLVNGNSNANNAAANRQNGAKPQPNGVQGGKGHQNQPNGARARSNQQNNSNSNNSNNNNGRANGQAGQNGAGQKKPVAQQRLPSADDFPALPNGHGPSAPSSSSSTSAAAAAAPASNANGVAKANFSAILSAPAPVKKQPEPVKESEAAASDDKAAATPANDAKAKETKTSASEGETKSSAVPAAKANGAAAPMLDFAAVVQSNPVAV
ncbi:uncharacterized protein SRS1_12056 [Sporisorium reilianum f. sp. reilianum]|uniref:C3H1-type domain-containing protein n=1 Tax=Sporisorium reilianum f. sp. reilianum TaxID=72559 RepID=A0A2N8U801_9BASI|nr:uncharacterized protein SRS1_12056 [Sporisorium reilianum f. sp. reilianum]